MKLRDETSVSIAAELYGMAGKRELSGGLATRDACSGRRCLLPKLAKLAKIGR